MPESNTEEVQEQACDRGPCWMERGHDGPCEPGSRNDPRRQAPMSTEKTPAGRLTVHTWGFFDSEGRPRIVDGVAVSAETPGEVITRVRANIFHHGGTCAVTHTVRTMDGRLVGAEWETPKRDDQSAARMWHKVMQESDAWPAPKATSTEEPRIRPASSTPEEA